jgi:ABC-type amino acid transport system permease subunit
MISPLALTGVSKVFPVYFVIIALSAGLSIGSTSIVSIIGLDELTRKANELVVSQYRPLEIYTFLVLEYLVLILVISYLVRKMEKKLSN